MLGVSVNSDAGLAGQLPHERFDIFRSRSDDLLSSNAFRKRRQEFRLKRCWAAAATICQLARAIFV